MALREPTPAELLAAYRDTALSFEGISFARAMQARQLRICLRGKAICRQRMAEQHGTPAPIQPALI